MATQALFRNPVRYEAAASFVYGLRTNNGGAGDTQKDNHLFAAIGRENDPKGVNQAGAAYGAGTGVWPDENNPPVPTSVLDDEKDFWCTMIAAQKVSPTDIAIVVPRRNWVTGTTYTVINETLADWYNGNFYVLTDLNECWICVVAGGGTSTVKPVRSGGLAVDNSYYNDGKASIYVAGDGYSWKYLFTIPSAVSDKMLETLWMPVPFTDTLWTPSGDPQRTQGRDDANLLLGAHHVLVRAYLDAGINGSGKMPAGLRYRQFGFLFNPRKADNTLATTGVYYQKNSINGTVTDELKKYSGALIYEENRSPILRETSQAEEYRIVLVF